MLNFIENRIKKNQFVLIAEIGVNYYDIAKKFQISPMEAAKKMIETAASAGAHAVKFQSYKAATLASEDSPYYWDISEEPIESQFKLFQKFDSFGKNEYCELSDYAQHIGIEFLSTPFDIESADYLEPLMNVYKISSSDLNNLPFIEYQAKKNKPIILSTGASNEDEIRRSVELIRKYNNQLLILMHCVLEYPTPYEHANLSKIVSLKEKFPDLVIGYSDHTKPNKGYEILKTAYCLGAKVIEKHFSLDKSLKGNDHYHAMDENDVVEILREVNQLDMILGDGKLCCMENEKKARLNARRSIVARTDIQAGTVITSEMVTFKRPGTGICVSRMEEIVGKKAAVDIRKDMILKEEMICLV